MSNAKNLENLITETNKKKEIDDFKELSLEINNEIVNRMIEDSKLVVTNIKESKIREEVDNKLNSKIIKNSKDIETLFEEVKKIKKEVNMFSLADDEIILEDNIVSEKKKEKEEILKKSETELLEKMNDLNNILDEKKSNQDENKKEELENKIKDTTEVIEKVKDDIKIKSDEIKIINESEESFKIAKKLELYKEEIIKFNNLYKMSEILFEEYSENHINTKKLMKSINSIVENISKIITNELNEDFNNIVSLFRSKSSNYDIEFMFSNKINTDNEKIYLQLNKKNLSEIKNNDQLKELEVLIKDSFNKIKDNNSKLKMKTKQIDTIYFEFKSLCHKLESIFKKINDSPVAEKPKVEVEKPKVEVEKPKVETEKPKVETEKPKVEVEKPREPVTPNPPQVEVEMLPILIRKPSNNSNNFSLPDSYLNNKNYLPTKDEMKRIFDIEVPKINLSTVLKVNDLKVEDSKLDGNTISNQTISRIVSGSYTYNNLKVVGPGMRAMIAFGKDMKETYKNVTFSDVEVTERKVKTFDEKSAIRLATMMNKLPDDRNKNTKYQVEKCYYSSLENEFIVPAYKVIATRNGTNLLNTVIPASTELFPILKVKSLEIKGEEVITKKVRFVDNNDKDLIGNGVKEKNQERIKFTVKVNEESINPGDKISIVSTFDVVDNFSKDKTFTLSLPKIMSKNYENKLDRFWVSIVSMNKFGFSNQIRVTLDFSPYKKLFEFVDLLREENPDHGGARHNYGIEWAECCLGATIYQRFIDEMNSAGVYKEYSLDPDQSLEKHFKDYDNLSSGTRGRDDYYVDNVDISAYIGHGSGDGFTFETSIDDGKLTDTDAKGGKAWGNRDLEFQALMSCQVLREIHGGRTWAERWGPSFNGMHLLLGFQTNAWVADHNMLKFFAKNMYKNKQTVLISWLNAALNDQPDDTEAVVMGPLVKSTNMEAYNSVASTIPTLYRAHWKDYSWGVKTGPGIDVPKSNVNGWWRIILTV